MTTAVIQELALAALRRVTAAGVRADDEHFPAMLHWSLCGLVAEATNTDYRVAAQADLRRWRHSQKGTQR